MTNAKIPEKEQQQIRAAFSSRATVFEVANARTLITNYAPKRSTRSRAWPSGLRRIHDNLGFHMEELLANNKRARELEEKQGTPIQSRRGGRQKAQVPQPRTIKRARAPKASSAKRPRAPPPDKCPICLEDLDASPALACGHKFHAACMRELAGAAWGNGNAPRTRGGTHVRCPLCQKQMRI